MIAHAQKAWSSSRGEVTLLAGVGIVGPDASGAACGRTEPDQGLPGGGELLAGCGLAGGGQQRLGLLAPLVGGADEDGQHGQPFPGPGVHPGLAAPHELAPGQIVWLMGQGATHGPHRAGSSSAHSARSR